MKMPEEAERLIAQLREENKALRSELEGFNEVKEELKAAKKRIRFLEEALENLRKELRKYHNENTPSGAIPPYLKPDIEIKREFVETTSEKRDDNRLKKQNIRNRRPKVIDRTEHLELKECPCCGGKLRRKKTKPTKRIIITMKIPDIESVKYITPRYYCPNCKKEVRPRVPNTLPNSKFDLTISIFISVLFIGMNMTQGKIAELFGIFGLNISKATVCNILARLKDYLGDKYVELEQRVLEAKSKCKDETSHRHNGKLNWVWVATTTKDVCYWIEEKRNYKTARKIFKGDKGVSTTDGYRAYDVPDRPIQRDWAHLFRKARNPEYWFISEKEIKDYKTFIGRLGALYHQAKIDKAKLGPSKSLREKYDGELFKILASVKSLGRNANNLISYIMHYNLDWFTFLEHKEVEPTSNRAEQMLRPFVIKRKISQQTRGEENKQSYAMQMSLYETSKLRGENYMEFLRHVVEDKLNDVGKI